MSLIQILRHTQCQTTIEDNLKPFGTRQLELLNKNGCIIPPQGKLQILQELYEGHPGVSRMKALARKNDWWPGLDKERVECCSNCQINHSFPPVASLHPWEWPSCLWSRIHLNFAGSFSGHMFLKYHDWCSLKMNWSARYGFINFQCNHWQCSNNISSAGFSTDSSDQ